MPEPTARAGNRLATETSPYLLQHAHQPVDWYPWGEEAFAAARDSGRPVLLSIGYSSCHWCHVMAHESFDDPETASLMNALFVNVKVDREERPDVDRVYQLAHHLLTRHGGGWPLTMFLTHDDRRPFFGGTYFPPRPMGGLPDLRTVLQRVARYYREHQGELRAQTRVLVETLERLDAPGMPATRLDAAPLARLRAALGEGFDRTHGGWGPAPKFPHPGILKRLLRDWHRTSGEREPDLHALFMATLTLKRMGDGGVHDQLGGGFFRYSVDERWEIPHFEKMLADNGQLLSAAAEVAAATGDPQFAALADGTAGFLLRDMRLPGGAFGSSLDADAGGHEGHYYLWTPEQVAARLAPEEAALFAARHGLDGPPNFEGAWHLRVARELSDLAAGHPAAGDEGALARRLAASREVLRAARDERAAPSRDDKILTGWNALAIRGLADAARLLDRDDLASAAEAAAQFLRAHHWRDGRLLAVSRNGPARLDATLDDHALLLDALLALLEVHFDAGHLHHAIALADALLERFEDQAHGGFFHTAHDAERLIHRPRPFSDEAIPSGNAIAVQALQRLGWLLGESRYLGAAERALRAAWDTMCAAPLATVHMATALEEHLHPPAFVILKGDADAIDAWRRTLQRTWQPHASVIAIPSGVRNLPAALEGKTPAAMVTGWLCRGGTCDEPRTELRALLAALQEIRAGT